MSQQQDAVASDAGTSEVDDIRRDIARTQDELGGTIDAIQDRLSPGVLMAEARGPVEDTTDHIVAEVQRAVQESVDHILAQAREPIEEVADHLIERVTAAAEEATDHILERARETATETVSSIVEQTGHAVRAATIGKVEKMASKINGTTRDMANNANETTRGFTSNVLHTIKRNPLPAALTAVGIGWLFMKRPKTSLANGSSSYYTPSYGSGGNMQSSGEQSGAMGSMGHAIGGAANSVADTMSGAASSVGGAVGDAASSVGDTVAGAAGAVGGVMSGATSAVTGTVGHVADGTQDVARNLFTEVQYQALRVEEGFKSLAQQNPLALGAAGLALGSLIGLAIPETQVEHKVMGGARDAVIDQASETAQDALGKVGHVAAEAGKTVKQEAVAGGLVS